MALTTIPSAGQKLRGSVLSSLITEVRPVFARRTSDSAPQNNTTALVNDTALFVPVAANAVYTLECAVKYSTNATADLKLAWTYPVGLTMAYDLLAIGAAGGAWQVFPSTETTVQLIDGSAASAHMTGLVIVGSTAGTLQLQWSQSIATVVNTFTQTGSYIKLTQVA